MGKYKVYHSQKFDEELSKFDKDFYNRVDKIEDQLVENPYVGDPISVKWFREKRYGKYRIYYLIYEDIQAVFMVGISEKKDQQKIINTIKFLFIVIPHSLLWGSGGSVSRACSGVNTCLFFNIRYSILKNIKP